MTHTMIGPQYDRVNRLGDLCDPEGYVQVDATHRLPVSYVQDDDVTRLLGEVTL